VFLLKECLSLLLIISLSTQFGNFWIHPRMVTEILMLLFLSILGAAVEIESEHQIFLFTTASRTALGPTQPPIQWVRGALSLAVNGRGVKLTTHFHLVRGQRMSGAIPPLPQYAFMAWCSVKRIKGTLPLLYTGNCTSHLK
jgi:hypothetical protein